MKRCAALSILGACSGALVGCGGPSDTRLHDGGAAGLEIVDPGSGPVDCSVTADLTLEPIGTFDLGSDGWYSYNDHTPGSFQEPPDTIYPVPVAELKPQERCGSLYAVHLRAAHLADWGGGLGTQFPGRPVDATRFDGIAFWARKAPTSFSALRLGVGDVHTSPEGGFCDPNAVNPDPSRCDDTFGSFVNLSQSWQFFRIDFAEMRQGGWGKHAPDFDLARLYSLSLAYQAGNWDIWIDDVFFFKRGRATNDP